MEFKFAEFFVIFVSTIVVPFLAQKLKNATMSRKIKFLIVLGLSAITGIAGYVVSGYPINDLVAFVTGAITLSVLSYELWWKKVFEESTVISRWFNKMTFDEELYGNAYLETPVFPEGKLAVKSPNSKNKKKTTKKPAKNTKK